VNPTGFQTTTGKNPPKAKLRNHHILGKELPDLAKAGGRTRQTASRLEEIRLSQGLTQIALCVKASTTLEVIRKAERGYLLQLKTATIIRLANALECGAADIFPVLSERLNRV
jgi:transcriptional regulator with XRE-family HTH domain